MMHNFKNGDPAKIKQRDARLKIKTQSILKKVTESKPGCYRVYDFLNIWSKDPTTDNLKMKISRLPASTQKILKNELKVINLKIWSLFSFANLFFLLT